MKTHWFQLLLVITFLGLSAVHSAVSWAQSIHQAAWGDTMALRFRIRNSMLMYLLLNESVQDELGLDKEERRKLTELLREFDKEDRQFSLARDAAAGTQEERQRKRNELGWQAALLEVEATKKLKALLTEEQLDRCHGISLQNYGAEALVQSEVARWLGLSKEQRQQLATIVNTYRKSSEELRAMRIQDSFENGRRQRELRETRELKAAEVLTAAQREKLAKAKGAPFQIRPNPPLNQAPQQPAND